MAKRIKNQCAIATGRGHFSRDVFRVGDRVCLRDLLARKWDILGNIVKELEADEGSIQSYEFETDMGQNIVQNGSHIHHSEYAESVF